VHRRRVDLLGVASGRVRGHALEAVQGGRPSKPAAPVAGAGVCAEAAPDIPGAAVRAGGVHDVVHWRTMCTPPAG
jgi:hypothetical protein